MKALKAITLWQPWASLLVAGVIIRDVRHEPLRGMTQADAVAEGYPTVSEYFAAFARIYGMAAYMRYLDEPLWVVCFELMWVSEP
jgi:hypothetical protein